MTAVVTSLDYEVEISQSDSWILEIEVEDTSSTSFSTSSIGLLEVQVENSISTNFADNSTSIVEITSTGAQGPPGPAGDTGAPGPQGPPGVPGEGAYYEEFTFASPSTVWIAAHNQHTFALNVEAFDFNGDPIEGTVLYPDQDHISINWYYPMTGFVRVFS